MPDGDRRYARQHRITYREAYARAATRVHEFIRVVLLEFDLRHVSVFLTRPATYIASVQRRGVANLIAVHAAIAGLIRDVVADQDLADRSVRIIGVGCLEGVPPRMTESAALSHVWSDIRAALPDPPLEGPQVVNFLINYSGSAALRRMCASVTSGDLLGMLDHELGEAVGLVIRTGDGMRMSDGPAHLTFDAHFLHLPCMFPDLTPDDVRASLGRYFDRSRGKQ